jgi:hypothetical protein
LVRGQRSRPQHTPGQRPSPVLGPGPADPVGAGGDGARCAVRRAEFAQERGGSEPRTQQRLVVIRRGGNGPPLVVQVPCVGGEPMNHLHSLLGGDVQVPRLPVWEQELMAREGHAVGGPDDPPPAVGQLEHGTAVLLDPEEGGGGGGGGGDGHDDSCALGWAVVGFLS